VGWNWGKGAGALFPGHGQHGTTGCVEQIQWRRCMELKKWGGGRGDWVSSPPKKHVLNSFSTINWDEGGHATHACISPTSPADMLSVEL
jgi:hypothetical protein